MKIIETLGATSRIWQVFIADSSSTTGAGLTGLLFNTASLTAYYHRDTDTTATAITLVTMTVGTFTSSGFKEIDQTNMPGWYQLCPPNAVLASGAKSAALLLKGATNMAPLPIEVQLSGFDLTTATQSVSVAQWNGTNVSSPATAGIPDVNIKNFNNVAATSVTTVNANQGTTQPLNFTGTAGSALVKSDMVDVAGAAVSTSSAQIGVNAVNIGGTAQTGRDIGASVLLSSGTGTGQLDFTSGVVKANLAQILGTALTETAGQIAAAFKQFFNIASPTSTMNVITTVTTTTTATTATNLTNAPAAGDFTAAMKTSLNAATPVVTLTSAYDAAKTAMASYTQPTGFLAATFPSSVASPTNITAGTITTATNVTNGVTLAAAAIDSASLATSGKAAIADSLLDRDMSTGTDSGTESIRTPRQALRVLRNKVDIPNGKVKKEDDTTDSWTFAVTTAAGNPVTVVDPT